MPVSTGEIYRESGFSFKMCFTNFINCGRIIWYMRKAVFYYE